VTNGSGSAGPLSHVRVLDFTQLLQGPMATQILGDLGAEVIKFEKPGGEWMRFWGILDSWTHGEIDSFLAFNRNKKSVAVNLKDPEVVDRIMELAETADVVVENFRPGVMDKLGLGYEDFRKVNPGIVYVSSSGYGKTGPYVEYPGQDILVQALSGILYLTGREEDPPMACGIGVSDEFTALHIVIGVLAALEHRRQTDEGQKVEVNLFSCTVAAQQQELTVHLNGGGPLRRAQRNLGHTGATGPFGIYQTSDGYMVLAMYPCPKLGEILGVSWLDEFDTNEKMFAKRDHIHALLSEHFAGNTTDHWLELLREHDVWCAPVQSYEDLEEDPQLAHQEMFWEVPVGDGAETFKTVGSPFFFSATPPALHRGVPRAGQDTMEFFPETGRAKE
jgi:crotonobetainyl-CoA:carnitine CoA-transferase CaiB-like acyl-CoA transferase